MAWCCGYLSELSVKWKLIQLLDCYYLCMLNSFFRKLFSISIIIESLSLAHIQPYFHCNKWCTWSEVQHRVVALFHYYCNWLGREREEKEEEEIIYLFNWVSRSWANFLIALHIDVYAWERLTLDLSTNSTTTTRIPLHNFYFTF